MSGPRAGVEPPRAAKRDRPPFKAVFFDFGDTLIVEEPGRHLWEMELKPMPHALELLQALKPQSKLGIISNTVGSGDAELRQVLDGLGMLDLIDGIVTSRDFGRAKPDAAIYREAARRLGVPLKESCMVGDRLETDIAGARNAGILSVWLRHQHSVVIPDVEPDRTVTSLLELRDWLLTGA